MLRGWLRATAVCSKHGRRFCDNAAGATAKGDVDSKSFKSPQKPRLWAMERVSKTKAQRVASMKAWRIPACIDFMVDWLPEGVGSLLYLDKLQVHQFYWKLGDPGFICTPFQLDIYERAWEKHYEKAKVLASVELYPHLININEDEDIINITLVSPKHWGRRCRLHYLGEQDCIGLKKGGIIKKSLTYLALDCERERFLPDIKVDLSNLDVGEEILIKDLSLDVNLMSNLKPTTPVCQVLSP
ncbi:hypothetical protein GOP47_0007087 [Adiantum capillus-veneris]|uniref:Large ribosomal subunit protein bL25 beta domain-containing protein n=1 Tax=Adiantum capillus-veneris TaxID=13818 RepID=A0A9D4V083_ADICA|nr:hypothetical protein GOP47_0007087 [Adiantum capillus-veneris]